MSAWASSNNIMQRTAPRAAADAERSAILDVLAF